MESFFDSNPQVKWFLENRHKVAEVLFIIWALIMCYWLYEFYVLDSEPNEDLRIVTEESFNEEDGGINARTAIAFILWFSTTGVLAILLALYIIKFAYNIVWGFVEGAFPRKWHYLLSSIAFLLSLWPCFNYMGDIKGAYLSLYSDGKVIVQLAMGLDVAIKKDANKMEDSYIFDDEKKKEDDIFKNFK